MLRNVAHTVDDTSPQSVHKISRNATGERYLIFFTIDIDINMGGMWDGWDCSIFSLIGRALADF